MAKDLKVAMQTQINPEHLSTQLKIAQCIPISAL